MGEILAETPKDEGGRPLGKTGSVVEPVFDTTPTLDDLGITKKQSSRAQKLASVPEETFSELLSVVEEVKGEVTTAAVMREIVRQSSVASRQEVQPGDYKKISNGSAVEPFENKIPPMCRITTGVGGLVARGTPAIPNPFSPG